MSFVKMIEIRLRL